MTINLLPGAQTEEVLTRRVRVRCAKCRRYESREVRLERAVTVLHNLGWRRKAAGWVCDRCLGHPVPLWEKRMRLDGGMGKLLQAWYRDGVWNGSKFASELGVTKQRVYFMRDQLRARGFVDPGDKKKLTVRLRGVGNPNV